MSLFHPQGVALEKSKTKIVQVSEKFEEEKKELLERKEHQIKDLEQELSTATEELNTQKDQTTAHRQLLEKVNLEKDELQVSSFNINLAKPNQFPYFFQ